MSKVTQLPPPAAQQPAPPTLQDLIAQRTTLVLQRSAGKDQIEIMERTLQVLNGMISVHQLYVKDEENTTKD